MQVGRIVAALVVVGCGPAVGVDEGAAETTGASATTTAASSSVGSASAATTSPGTTGDLDSSTASTDVSSTVSLTAPDTLEPDGGDGPFECDQFLQDCPRGTKCMPWADDGGDEWNATRCTAVAEDPRHAGQPCTVVDSAVSGIDDCDGASMCWNVAPETLMGTCIPFCTGSEAAPICANACDSCSLSSGGVLAVCLPGCDPLGPACVRGDECVPYGDGFVCAPDASGAGGGLGEPCEDVNACDPGLFCATSDTFPDCADSVGCCAPFCNAGAADLCDIDVPGTVCVPWYTEGERPEGCFSSIIGACLLPS